MLGQVGGGLFQRRFSEASGALGLPEAAAMALLKLEPDAPISQKELSARLHCTPSTVVDPTDRLERMGLVSRRPHREDRRVNELVVTAKGKRVRARLIAGLLEPPPALRDLGVRDQATLRGLLRKLAATEL